MLGYEEMKLLTSWQGMVLFRSLLYQRISQGFEAEHKKKDKTLDG
jgi:hypothetical protein